MLALFHSHGTWSNTATMMTVIAVVFFAATMKKKRRTRKQLGDFLKGEKTCDGCGLANPTGANFCRRCGRALR